MVKTNRFSIRHPYHTVASLLAVWVISTAAALAQVIELSNEVEVRASLSATTVNMTGRSELRVTQASTPLSTCQINLNSPDSWLFLTNVKPSAVISGYLNQVRVNGAAAVSDMNVRVVQYGMGAVVIPHEPSYRPLEIFRGYQFSGTSSQPALFIYHNDSNLGVMNNAISSFRLKRGYMATFAQHSDGRGISKVYVAQDGDIEVSTMPANLDDSVSFIRVLPWRWVGKKGSCDVSATTLNAAWTYNWNNDLQSSPDVEYVPIRQTLYWPDYGVTGNKQNVTHLLGFNEPDSTSQANMSVAQAIGEWPALMASGLRVGSPAVTDGGAGWLYDFIDQADALNYRVDYVAVHYYRGGQTAQQFYDYLKAIHLRTKRPIWITEFNNGANWTCCRPSYEENAADIAAFIDMLDNAPFVERYAVYSRVEAERQMTYDDGWPTPAGFNYIANESPVGYRQALPSTAARVDAFYPFENATTDASGQSNDAVRAGTPAFVPGKNGQAISLDGTHDWLALTPSVGKTTDFTFAAWIKWDGGAIWQRIFDFGGSPDRYFFLTPRSAGGKLRFAINTGAGEQVIDAANALPTGVWTHVAVTLRGDTGKLFVNGTVAGTNTSLTFYPADFETTHSYLGKSQFAGDPLFDGALDDVLIAGYAFPDSRIQSLAGTERPPVFTSPLVVAGATQGRIYQASVAGTATDPDAGDSLTYSKADGPAWLGVANNGTLYGTPGPVDAGTQDFSIRVTDSRLESAVANLAITISPGGPAMVARYAFDGNANATVGSANGVATGAPAYVAGRQGQAVDLDGIDDFVTLPAGIAASEDITIAMWVHWDGGDEWQRIFDFGGGTGNYLFLSPRSSTNTMRFTIKNGATEQYVQTGALPTGQWLHIAVTLGGTTGKIYLNGGTAATGTITLNPTDIDRTLNYIGKSQWPNALFNGRIDNFMIFNHALSATEISALITKNSPVFTSNPISRPGLVAGQSVSGSLAGTATDADAGDTLTFRKISGPSWLGISPAGDLSGTPGFAHAGNNRFIVRVTDQRGLASEAAMEINVTAGNGLVAQYGFDGNSNSSVNGLHGTSGGSPAFVTGKSGDALDLDGTDDSMTLPASVTGLTDMTVSTWVRWDGGNIWQRIFDFGNTNEWMFITPRSGNGTLRFTITGSGGSNEQILETSVLPTGRWVHLAVSLLGNTGRLYVDGVEAASGTITLDPTVLSPAQNYIGKSQWAPPLGGDPYFNGQVDDFRIYSRALTGFEISTLAHQDADSDGDSYTDSTEGIGDPDLDGVLNWLDADSDGDGLGDHLESYLDTDADGLANIRDPDSDNDTLPDGWEAANGMRPLDATDATGDLDGDGQSNSAEYTAGTSPNDGGDFLKAVWTQAPVFTLTLMGKAGRIYTFQRSISLDNGGWADLQTVGPLASGQPVSFSDESPVADLRFYRVKVSRP